MPPKTDEAKKPTDTKPTTPKPPRAPRSDKGAARMPPSAVEVIKKREQWVQARINKIGPEYLSLVEESKRNRAALDALSPPETP